MTSTWLQRLRVALVTNSLVPLLFGQAMALASSAETTGWAGLRWALFMAGLHHAVVSAARGFAEVGDTETQDPAAATPSLQGPLQWVFWISSTLLLAGAAHLGLHESQPAIPALVVVAIAGAWALEGKPGLARRGHGELVQAGLLGLLLPVLGFILQGGNPSHVALLALIPSFFVAYASCIVSGLPTYPADRAANRRTYAVRRGQLRARTHALQILGASALLSWMVVPQLRGVAWSWLPIVVPTVLLLLSNVQLLGSADAQGPGVCRGECRRFVIVAAVAAQLLLLAWSIALASFG